jgi:hypothetical protein
MQVFVQILTGEWIALEVQSEDTNGDLKARIEVRTHIPSEQQSLKSGKQSLKDGRRIHEYSVRNHSALRLRRRQQGGRSASCAISKRKFIASFKMLIPFSLVSIDAIHWLY